MGFSAGLYSYPKHNDLSLPELRIVEHYLEYEKNEWAKKYYETANDYVISYHPDNTYVPDEDTLAWAREAQIVDEFNEKHLYKNIDDWCSGGAHLNDMFEKYKDEDGQIKRDGVINIVKEMYDMLNDYDFRPFIVREAFVDKEDDEGEYTKVFPVDGIRLYDGEDGTIKEVYTKEEGIITSDKYIDPYEFYTFISILGTMIKLLDFDFENSYLVYTGGW